MKTSLFLLFSLIAFNCQAADWKPKYIVKNYLVSGSSPIELYTSIGENGPTIGQGRKTIALTEWDLKWRRDYQPDGTACVLKSALPFLTITYTLPKPKAKLSGDLAKRFEAFLSGMAAHEKVHGADIVTMTETIIANTVGLRVENDAGCKLIRGEVLKRAQAAADQYKAKSRAFDQSEMSAGGNVQQLILGLVN
ncbi:MAG: DUF922 domain-containing protein [Rhizobiaceae bacterium]